MVNLEEAIEKLTREKTRLLESVPCIVVVHQNGDLEYQYSLTRDQADVLELINTMLEDYRRAHSSSRDHGSSSDQDAGCNSV